MSFHQASQYSWLASASTPTVRVEIVADIFFLISMQTVHRENLCGKSKAEESVIVNAGRVCIPELD